MTIFQCMLAQSVWPLSAALIFLAGMGADIIAFCLRRDHGDIFLRSDIACFVTLVIITGIAFWPMQVEWLGDLSAHEGLTKVILFVFFEALLLAGYVLTVAIWFLIIRHTMFLILSLNIIFLIYRPIEGNDGNKLFSIWGIFIEMLFEERVVPLEWLALFITSIPAVLILYEIVRGERD